MFARHFAYFRSDDDLAEEIMLKKVPSNVSDNSDDDVSGISPTVTHHGEFNSHIFSF